MASPEKGKDISVPLSSPITMPPENQSTVYANERRSHNQDRSKKRSSRRSRKSSIGSSSPDSPGSPVGNESEGGGGSGWFRRLRSFFSKKEQEHVVDISGTKQPPPSTFSYKQKETPVGREGTQALTSPTTLMPPQANRGGESPRLTSALRGKQLSARTVAEVTENAKTQTDDRSGSPSQASAGGTRFPRSLSEGTILSEDSPGGSHPVSLTVKLIKSLDDRNADPLIGSRNISLRRGTGGFGLVLGGANPVIVMKVAPNGPADRAGILVNDMIVAVNKIDVRNRSYADVQQLIHSASRKASLDISEQQMHTRRTSSGDIPPSLAAAPLVNLKLLAKCAGEEMDIPETTTKTEMGKDEEDNQSEDNILKQLQEAAGMIAEAALSSKPDLPEKPSAKRNSLTLTGHENGNDERVRAFECEEAPTHVRKRRGSVGETEKKHTREEILAMSKSAPASPSTQRKNKLKRASSQKGGAFIVEHKSGRMVAVPSRPSILPADENTTDGQALDPKKVHIDSGYQSLPPGEAEISELETALSLASARMTAANKRKTASALPTLLVTSDDLQPPESTPVKHSEPKTAAKPSPVKSANLNLKSKSMKVPGRKADLDFGDVPNTKPLLGLDAGHARLSVARQRHRSQRRPTRSRPRPPADKPLEADKPPEAHDANLDTEAVEATPKKTSHEATASSSKLVSPGVVSNQAWKADLQQQLEEAHLKRQKRSPDTSRLSGPSTSPGVNLVIREKATQPMSAHSPKRRATERHKRLSSADIIEKAATLGKILDEKTTDDRPHGHENVSSAISIRKQSAKSPSALPRKQSTELAPALPRKQSTELAAALPRKQSTELAAALPRKQSTELAAALPRKQSTELAAALPRKQSTELAAALPRKQSTELAATLPRKQSGELAAPFPRKQPRASAAALPRQQSTESNGTAERQQSGSGRLKTVDLPVKTLGMSSSPSLNDAKVHQLGEPNWVALARGKSERLSKRNEVPKKKNEDKLANEEGAKRKGSVDQSSIAITPSWVAMAVAKQRGTAVSGPKAEKKPV